MDKKIDKTKKTEQHRWQYLPLTPEDIKNIHDTSMQVLEDVGVEVQLPEAFKLFKKAGASVDSETGIVKFKESLLMDIISSAPSEITLYSRNEHNNLTLGAGNVYFGTGGTALNVLDFTSGKQRPSNMKDLIDIIRLVDNLENIHLMLLPTYPNELPVKDVDINRFIAGMCFTSKHIMGGIYTSKGIDDVISTAEKIAGSAEALRKKPFISMIACGISPLRLDTKYGKFMIKLAKKSIPTAVPVEPLCGATAPVTLAGTLVIQNCDGLFNIALTQLANPGAPVIYGSVATSVNLYDVGYLGGPVESGMINAATSQLARYYKLPFYSTAGISDSKTLDTQCGYETAINNLLVALAGGDFIHDAAGLMEFATTVSKEKLVMDNEILGMVLRAVKGIQVNEKTLAFDTIRNAGPGGSFIADRHTRRFMYKEHFFTKLSDRDSRKNWIEKGSRTTAQKAHEIVKKILSDKKNFYLKESAIKELIDSFPHMKAEHFLQ